MRLKTTTIGFALAVFVSSAGYAQGDSPGDTPPDEYEKALAGLNSVKGPQNVQLFDVASINVPLGYVFLNPEDTDKFETLNENPSSGTRYLLAPADLHWFSLFRFSRDGYVRDDEKIEPDSILASIRRGTDAANEERRRRGWSELNIVGWKLPPFYDGETHRLEWAVNAESAGSPVINFNTRILGRGGVTSATLVVDPQAMDSATTEFKTLMRTYEYLPGQRYTEFRSGDKVAEYGLAALVAGGAAAVATKTGFWKSIVLALGAAWKLVAAALVGAVTFLKNLFGRKSDDNRPQEQ